MSIKNYLYITAKRVSKKILPRRFREYLKQKLLIRSVKKIKTQRCDKTLPHGVNIIGIVRSGKGIGSHTRLIARALETVNIPFCIIDICEHFGCSQNNFDYDNKISNKQIYNVNLIPLNADCIQHALIVIDRKEMNKRYNIGYWAWELAEFPDIWKPVFNCFQEIWANSQFCANSVAMKSPIPTLAIPLYAGYSNNIINDGREYFNLKKDIFLFMIAYDCESFVERKNPKAAVDAFMKAFSPAERNIGLVLKLFSSENHQAHINDIKEQLKEYSNIYYIEKYLSNEEMHTLISVSDSYVSLHRAEGFGLIPIEAMALGTPVISTAWSGNMEYMNNKNAALVDYQLIPVNGQYLGTSAGEDYLWADPDIEEAANLMRRMVCEKKWREELINNGKKTAINDFNANIMGNKIRKRLKVLELIS